ncbi:terminase [Nocardioides marmoriginsengisoli]|uniref:terminase n=1 Tax=Nocardioides marmoriginsengisoli TaxID=661483 RepID=UPI00160FF983|nr:terminase [Nocardioides marmoriginsengisoli]
MARSSGPAFVEDLGADYRAIEQEYRDLLERSTPPVDLQWEPVKIGPTWQYDNGWLLPEASLGWGFLSWTTRHLTGKGTKPWWWTAEQTRFLLWYYAVDSDGDFLYRSGRLQRLKGWGKDPTAAGISIGSLHAPIMFDHWEGDRPIGRDDPEAWTQIAAVSQDQTKNTFKLFPSLIPRATRTRYGISVGKLNVWSDGDQRQIEGISTAADSNEGGRPHLIIRAETQNWLSTNGGHDLAGAMDGNAAKAEQGTPARVLDIFNAYRPGRDSVAERAREAWESTQGDNATNVGYGVLWDSLEAPPEAPLTREAAPEVIRCIAGDASWLDVRPKGTIMESILNPENSPSESRRKWYNQIVGTEDAWAQPHWIDRPENRRRDDGLQPGDRVALFGDGSKSGDDTGLIAIRISDGLAQLLHHQHPGVDADNKPILVDRNQVDLAVTVAFDTYKVVAFYFDPSHAKADDAVEDDRFWWPMVDRWHERYHRRLDKKFWPVKSGPKLHSIAFDMSASAAQQLFQPAVTQVAEDMEAGEAPYRTSDVLRRHLKNARRREGRFGITIGKESRSSARKVDLAVCFVGARMLWRIVRLSQNKGTPGKGRVLIRD